MPENVAGSRWRHDMKNQLGIVLGFSELILQDLADVHPLRADLDEILVAAQRAMALVAELEPEPDK